MSYINGIITKMIDDRIQLIKTDYPDVTTTIVVEEESKIEPKMITKEIKKSQMDNLMENMFKRPWNKLPYFHREMKVIEYSRKNNLDEKEYKKMLYEKKLTSKSIQYDEKNGLIIKIIIK
jgi:uncharacterized protein YaaW (UPF0174 family)